MRKVKNYTMAALILGMSLALTACGDNGNRTSVTEKAAVSTEAPKEIVDSELYDSFINNEAKALFRSKTGIRTATTFNIGTALEEGESYTIKQIVFLLQSKGNIPKSVEPDITYDRIDCGSDGVQELLVKFSLGNTEMDMIIKDIDGELVICYAEECNFSKDLPQGYFEFTLNPDGTSERFFFSKGRTEMEEYSYVDGNGDYHLYYGLEKTTRFVMDYTVETGGKKVKVWPDGLDGEHIVLYDYYFSDDEHFISYEVIDDNGNEITTDKDYDDSNEVVKRFADEGVKIYSDKEIEKLLKDRAKEIGYPVK